MRGSQDDDLVPLHQPFEPELRGFNRRQVLEHLESLDGRIAMVTADRDAALVQVAELSKVLNHLRSESEELRREADEATSRVERILATPMAGASARIQRIMWLAAEEAAELHNQAEAATTARMAHAEAEIAELRAHAEDEISTLRADASREASSLLEHARRRRDQLEAESAARRRTAEWDATRALAQRESAANARIRDNERRALARLHLMLHAIGEQLSSRLRAVERDELAQREQRAAVAEKVAALEALRAEVTTAVASAHQVLGEALGQVDAPPVPAQRGTEGGTVYLLGAGTEERRFPRGSP